MEFKVFGVSENTNSFGLYGIRLMNRAGHFYTVGASSFRKPQLGAVIEVPIQGTSMIFGKIGFEIPERHYPDAPQNVIDQVWDL